jgi:hypothetical protein
MHWWVNASEEQRARFRAAVSQGQKRAWLRGRTGNYRHPKARIASLEAQGIPANCVRFYWRARDVVGYHNPKWSSSEIIRLIKWFTGRYGTGDAAFHSWHYWLVAPHRIGQHDHMKPCYRCRLPEIDAQFKALFPKASRLLRLNMPSPTIRAMRTDVFFGNISPRRPAAI